MLYMGIAVCMAYLFSCTNNPTANSGGTSIEVVGITGYVALPDSGMAAGSRVGLRKIIRDPVGVDSANNSFIAVTTADHCGRFALPCSLSGEFIVEATATNGFKGARACSLFTKERKSLDTIVCRPTGGLRGTISVGINPSYFFVDVWGLRYNIVPDSNGLFVSDSLSSGIYTLRIRPAYVTVFENNPLTDSLIEIHPGEEYTFLDTLIEIHPGMITDCGMLAVPTRASFKKNAAYCSDMAVVASMMGADSSVAAQITAIDDNGRVVSILDLNNTPRIKTLSGVGTLDQLQWLWLFNTQIDTLPNELSHCTKLFSLRIVGGALSWIGDSVAQNRNLFEVLITDCALEHVPPALMRLPQETYIILSGNQICNPTTRENEWLTNRLGKNWSLHYVQKCN